MGTLLRESAMITEDAPRPEAPHRRPFIRKRSVRSWCTMTANAHAGRSVSRRLILFGAFDRHNFGDILLAHCAVAAHRGRTPVFAGLLSRDLTVFGGHRVRSLAEIIAAYRHEAADFVHVGGELLTTTAWEAAVMLQSPADAARAIAMYDRSPETRRAWAQTMLTTDRRIPYAISAAELPTGWTVHFNAVGGVALTKLPTEEHAEVLRALRTAGTVSVRDAVTHAALKRAGISAELACDPASATPRLFGELISLRARNGEVAAIARRTPCWIAVQLAAHYGDDATLDRIASALRNRAIHANVGIVLFRAGLAPWHDDRETLERLFRRLAGLPVNLFESAHVLDVCALLSGARAYLGTSLHGWIVANSFGVPAHCLVSHDSDKAAAYIDTWHASPRRWRKVSESDLVPVY
ncbi:polysaccharide pyruvyl transferase family protein [Aromatoleum diolicum]|uniref:Polysaccharide pyruvyl transferase family protein n=1 Tax=Aromatoleum diolicum TaxID=75796 RepID=A0ABX1QAX1_9RHOO|nr:polysaccharide pyruvyl transferase family protein [Aromatoleum diolicum]NMG75532.1 polysaccharide pyruvyl transferase family protein [Aromatoleum diolicum]